MINKTFQLSGMHCVSCCMCIEGELEDMGVEAKANYAKQTVEVTFDPKKVVEEAIVDAISRLGYRVMSHTP